jgi:RNA polymerase sigma factor (TIGR02999 family)
MLKMDKEGSKPVTSLLTQWKSGDPAALQELIPIVYDELHRLARRQLRSERSDHTLQSTALVNEAYLRLVGQDSGQINSRTHFLGVASHVMRQILVDHARSRRAAKRDGGNRVELNENDHPLQEANIDIIALDDALTELANFDPDLCRIVEMRYLGGLSVDATAEAMGVSPASIKREWTAAKAWLSRKLRNK